MNARTPLRRLALLATVALFATACGGSDAAPVETAPLPTRIIVTSIEGDSTSALLAAIYAKALEQAGFRVSRKDPVSLDRAGYYAALQEGTIQLVPEFTGDLLHFLLDEGGSTATTIAGTTPSAPATTQAPIPIDTAPVDTSVTTTTVAATPVNNGRSVAEQLVLIRSLLAGTVSVSNGSSAEDKLVVACSPEAVTTHENVQFITLTNLASVAPDITLGAPADWLADTTAGLAAFVDHYGPEFAGTVAVEADGIGAAIDQGSADCFVVNALDPVVARERLTVMVDDKVFVPSNAVVALLSEPVATPDLVATLDAIGASLTTQRLAQMLNEINANGTDPVVVANAFLDTL